MRTNLLTPSQGNRSSAERLFSGANIGYAQSGSKSTGKMPSIYGLKYAYRTWTCTNTYIAKTLIPQLPITCQGHGQRTYCMTKKSYMKKRFISKTTSIDFVMRTFIYERRSAIWKKRPRNSKESWCRRTINLIVTETHHLTLKPARCHSIHLSFTKSYWT